MGRGAGGQGRAHVRLLIPSVLHSDTGQQPCVTAQGATVVAVLDDLERQCPGIRFRMLNEQRRIRRHIRFFYRREMVFDLDTRLAPDGELMIVQALSGG